MNNLSGDFKQIDNGLEISTKKTRKQKKVEQIVTDSPRPPMFDTIAEARLKVTGLIEDNKRLMERINELYGE